MRANWWGIQGQRLVDGFGRFSRTEIMGGIIESETDHHSAEYSITEELYAVYRNFHTELQGLKKQAPSARTVDLGTIDILRDRERGVPRYCAFRRALRMKVHKTFEELCESPEDAKSLREI